MNISNQSQKASSPTLCPKKARDTMLQRQARNDKRLLTSCALAGAAVLGPGLAGALFDAWPGIVAGFALACIVLAMEWGRWKGREKLMKKDEIHALCLWIESQDDPHQEARKISSGHYSPEIARVATQWLHDQEHKRNAQETLAPLQEPTGPTHPRIRQPKLAG